MSSATTAVPGYFSNFANLYGVTPMNTGFTPAGVVGATVPGPHMPGPTSFSNSFANPMTRLFGDMYTGSPYGFNALDNIGPMTVDQYNFGKVNMKVTAINTYIAVLGIGSWILRRLCSFVITNKQSVWRRYDMMRMLTAQRVGHADIPDVTTSRTINWMSSGERYGQAADARLQELMDPEIGPIVAQRMLDTVAAGIMHRLELAVIQQCRVEAAMRPWFESGGVMQTSEAFMDDEHINRREHFGMLNYSPGVAASKLSQFINKKMAGKTDRIVGCLPYAARHRFLSDQSFRYSTRQNVAADVSIDEFVGRFILGYTAMKRAEVFPLEAARDPALLGDGAAREFASLAGIPFYLEPPASMNTGEQDTMLSVLNGHYTFASFMENPPISDSGVLADYPNTVEVYDQGIDNVARLEAASALEATGVWRASGNSYSTTAHGHYPKSGQVMAGFSQHLRDYALDLASANVVAIRRFNDWNAAFEADLVTHAHAISEHVDADTQRDLMVHPLVTVWDGEASIAQCIGHIHPRFLLNTHVITIARRIVDYVAECQIKCGSSIDDIYEHIKTSVDFIKSIPFTMKFATALLHFNGGAGGRYRISPHDGVAELETTARGALVLPTPEQFSRWDADTTSAAIDTTSYMSRGLYAGCYSAPHLESIAAMPDAKSDHEYSAWMRTLREYWPKWKAFIGGLTALMPYSGILATNLLPYNLQPEKTSSVTAATFYLFPGSAVALKEGLLGSATRRLSLRAQLEAALYPSNVNLFSYNALIDSGLSLSAYVENAPRATLEEADRQFIAKCDDNGVPVEIATAIVKHVNALTVVNAEGRRFLVKTLDASLFPAEDAPLSDPIDINALERRVQPYAIKDATLLPERNGAVRVPLLCTPSATLEDPWILLAHDLAEGDLARFADATPGLGRASEITRIGAYQAAVGRERERLMRRARGAADADIEPTRRAVYRGAEVMDLDEEGTFSETALLSGASEDEAFDDMLQIQLGTEKQRRLMVARWRMLNVSGVSGMTAFVARCYLSTPNTIQAWKVLASAKCGSLLPVKMVYSRWHQRFQGYAMLLIEQGGVTVYTTPVYSVFAPDQINDMALLYGKVMQNIVLDNYDKAAVAECAYVRQQVCGRHTAYITPDVAARWQVARFQLSTTRESVIPFMEPIGHVLHDIITQDNTIGQYARRTLRIKGVPSIGYWHSCNFVTRHSHANYFQSSSSVQQTKNILLPSSWSDLLGNMNHLTNFATTYLQDNFIPNFCFRGFYLVPRRSEKPLVVYGYAGCVINDVFWNAPGLNNNLANQKPIDLTEASAVLLRYA